MSALTDKQRAWLERHHEDGRAILSVVDLLEEFWQAFEVVEEGIVDFDLHNDAVMRLRAAREALYRSGAAGKPTNAVSHSVPADDDAAVPETPTLFDQLPDPGDDRLGRFSAGSPDTQRTAAVKVYPKTGTQRRKVLDALAVDDLTDEQIESRIHIGQRQVSTRRKELEMDGWIMDSEVRRISRAGFEVVVWTLTAQGRDQYPGLDS